MIIGKKSNNAQELAATAAALARAGDTQQSQAVFTQALHAADAASKATKKARFSPAEARLEGPDRESKVVVLILGCIIFAALCLGYFVVRYG